jgi:hypothetical protein
MRFFAHTVALEWAPGSPRGSAQQGLVRGAGCAAEMRKGWS